MPESTSESTKKTAKAKQTKTRTKPRTTKVAEENEQKEKKTKTAKERFFELREDLMIQTFFEFEYAKRHFFINNNTSAFFDIIERMNNKGQLVCKKTNTTNVHSLEEYRSVSDFYNL